MRKARILFTIVALMAVSSARAQSLKPPDVSGEQAAGVREERARKVIQLKYADPEHVSSLLIQFGASLRSDRPSKVLTVVGPPAAVAAVEEAVKTLDMPTPPAKDVDLTAYFVLATRQPMQAADVPPELDQVITQLKRVVNYGSFHLLDTAFLRTRDGGGASLSGVARAETSAVAFQIHFRYADIIPGEKVRTVRIADLGFKAERAVGSGPSAEIHTDIDIAEGQKVVVGRTVMDFPDSALILVLTAKVTD